MLEENHYHRIKIHRHIMSPKEELELEPEKKYIC